MAQSGLFKQLFRATSRSLSIYKHRLGYLATSATVTLRVSPQQSREYTADDDYDADLKPSSLRNRSDTSRVSSSTLSARAGDSVPAPQLGVIRD